MRIKFTRGRLSPIVSGIIFFEGAGEPSRQLAMRIIDRYVFVEWAKVFAAAIGVTLGILVLHDMYDDLGKLLDYGASIPRILFYYWLLLPSFVPVVLPISLLISIIFILGTFHKNNEITAMRASGMNVFRITRSLWAAGLALSCFMFWMNAHVVPVSVERSRTLFNNLRFEKEKAGAADGRVIGQITNLCFNNRADSRLWFINKFSQATKKAYGVEIHELGPDGFERSKILAREGVFDDVDMCWFFTDGQQIFFDEKTGRPERAEVFEKKYFRSFRDDPQIMKLSMARAKDLSLFELRDLMAASGGGGTEAMRPYAVRMAGIWASPFACLIVVAIAIPFSIAGVRTNPMVGVSKTAGLFFAYYILDSIFSALGSNGTLPVDAAAWLPNVLMFAFALSLYRKNV